MEDIVALEENEVSKRSSIKELKLLVVEDNYYNIFAIQQTLKQF